MRRFKKWAAYKKIAIVWGFTGCFVIQLLTAMAAIVVLQNRITPDGMICLQLFCYLGCAATVWIGSYSDKIADRWRREFEAETDLQSFFKDVLG